MARHQGFSEAINAGLNGYLRGRQIKEQEQDRAHNRNRRTKLDERADEEYNYNLGLRSLNEEDQEYKRDRRDKTDARADENYNYNLGLRPLKEKALKNKSEADELSIEQKRRLADKEGLVDAMRYLKLGQPDKAMAYYNQTGEGRVKDVQKHPSLPDTWIATDANDEGFTIAPDDILSALGANQKPIALGGNQRLVNPSSGEEIIGIDPRSGKAGATPAILQETNAIYKRLPTVQGENDDQRWLRAHATASQKSATSPQDARAKFYSGLVTTLMKNAYNEEERTAASTQAQNLTDEFMDTYYSEASQPALGAGGGTLSPEGGAPYPGAQQAPDGNWYVEKDGKFYKVEQ